jgi:hypothetical protein
MGFHAPDAAPELFGACVAVGLWAVLADGALAVRGVIGLGLHRQGLLVLAAGLAVLPFVSGKLTHLELLVPCLLVAAVFTRVGLVRWEGLAPVPGGRAGATAAGTSATAPAVAPARPAPQPTAPSRRPTPQGAAPSRRAAATARVFGRATGRAGTIISRDVNVAIPRAARVAGRVAGRARRPPDQP